MLHNDVTYNIPFHIQTTSIIYLFHIIIFYHQSVLITFGVCQCALPDVVIKIFQTCIQARTKQHLPYLTPESLQPLLLATHSPL